MPRKRIATSGIPESRCAALRIPAFAVGLLLLFAACPKPQTRGAEPKLLSLVFADSLRLPGQAIGLAADRDGLLSVDNMGTNIFRVSLDLNIESPLALPTRVPGISTLAADPFHIYLFDDTRLLRLDRSRGVLIQVAGNVRGLSAAVLSSGQLAFSDAFSNRVLILDPSGTMTDFDIQVSVQPGALAFGRDLNFYILDLSRQRVVIVDRVGNPLGEAALPGPSRNLAVDDSLNIYLLDRTGSRIWQIDRHGRVAMTAPGDLGDNVAASDIVIVRQFLYLLSSGRTILKFRLPLP